MSIFKTRYKIYKNAVLFIFIFIYIFYINILYFIPTNGSVDIHSGHLNIYFVYILPEDGHRSGPKHVVSSAQ
jgi:hypothetical protein